MQVIICLSTLTVQHTTVATVVGKGPCLVDPPMLDVSLISLMEKMAKGHQYPVVCYNTKGFSTIYGT